MDGCSVLAAILKGAVEDPWCPQAQHLALQHLLVQLTQAFCHCVIKKKSQPNHHEQDLWAQQCPVCTWTCTLLWNHFGVLMTAQLKRIIAITHPLLSQRACSNYKYKVQTPGNSSKTSWITLTLPGENGYRFWPQNLFCSSYWQPQGLQNFEHWNKTMMP